MLTAQNSVCVPLSNSLTDVNGGGFLGYAGEKVHAIPPSTIVFPSQGQGNDAIFRPSRFKSVIILRTRNARDVGIKAVSPSLSRLLPG